MFIFQSPGGAHDPQCSRKLSTSQQQGRDVPILSEEHPSLNKRSYSATDLKQSTKAKPNPKTRVIESKTGRAGGGGGEVVRRRRGWGVRGEEGVEEEEEEGDGSISYLANLLILHINCCN